MPNLAYQSWWIHDQKLIGLLLAWIGEDITYRLQDRCCDIMFDA
jgi:hypothetical protein